VRTENETGHGEPAQNRAEYDAEPLHGSSVPTFGASEPGSSGSRGHG
jgi:hypothetical protein